jgi:iron complex outermembrane recepter protein
MNTRTVIASFRASPKGDWQFTIAAIFFFIIGAVVALAQPPPATGGSIQGVFTVPAITARSITAVGVQIVETGQTTTVDGNGRYAFTAVAPGTYTLVAAGEGFSRLRITEVSVDPGQFVDVGRREMPVLVADGRVQTGAEMTQSYRETDVVKLDRFVVGGGKRVAFTDANIDIPRSENDVQPYRIITGEEMEFSGSLTVEDFLKEKLSMDATERSNGQIYTGGVGTTSSISLRGLGPDRTLVLINGRRVQGTDQQVSNLYGMQPDLNSIPQAAIDRIEVLPTGASAIYGASAIGGVINVVLKQNYTGGQVSLTYQNSFDTDAPTRVANMLYGVSLEGGRTQLQLTATYRDVAPILFQDKPEIALRGIETVLRNRPATFYTNASPPSLGTTTNIALNPAVVNGFTNAQNATLTLDNGTPLNSLTTHIPAGISATTPQATLHAGLLANAGRYNLEIDSGDGVFSKRNEIGLSPTVKAYSASLTRQMTSRFQLFGEFRYGENYGRQIYNRISRAVTYAIPGNAPNNPFRENVSVHFPTLLGTLLQTYSTTKIASLGAVVQLPGDWRAVTDLSWSENWHAFSSFVDDTTAGNAALANGTVNPFVDTTLNPIDLQPYVASYQYDGTAYQKYISTRASGTLFDLWAGRPMITAGVGYQIQGYDDTTIRQRMPFTKASSVDLVYLPQKAKTGHAYTEFQIPLVRAQNRIPLVRSLDMQLAGRYETFEIGTGTPSYSYFLERNPPVTAYSAPTINGQPYFETTRHNAMNYTAGMKYLPVEDVTLRWSFATAFIPPTAAQLIPARLPSTTPTIISDPLLGTSYGVQTQGGGNRDLTPQNTANWNAGAIWQPEEGKLKGLRLEVNYFYVKENDLIGSLTADQIVNNSELQDRVSRDPSTNRITLVDTSLLNLNYYETAGLDIAGSYRKTTRIGSLSLSGSVTITDFLRKQTSPTAPFFDYVDYPTMGGIMKRKASGTFAWGKRGLTLGWTTRYISSYGVYGAPGSPAPSTIYTGGQGSDTVDSQLYHDIFGSYVFGRGGKTTAAQNRFARMLLKGVTLKAGIRNVLDEPPPLDAFRSPYFYSNYGNPRGREYWISVRKDF